MTISSFQAAYKICDLSDWTVTHLKLQKMLYISHLYFLGQNQKPLIDEQFEAWMYGPVLPHLYSKAKVFGDRPMRNIFFNVNPSRINEELKFIEEIYDQISNFSPWELVLRTHLKGGAWEKNFDREKKNKKISNQDILEEYNKFYEA